jgi:hypothetical protein
MLLWSLKSQAQAQSFSSLGSVGSGSVFSSLWTTLLIMNYFEIFWCHFKWNFVHRLNRLSLKPSLSLRLENVVELSLKPMDNFNN